MQVVERGFPQKINKTEGVVCMGLDCTSEGWFQARGGGEEGEHVIHLHLHPQAVGRRDGKACDFILR